MKKYKTFTSPILMLYTFAAPLTVFLWMVLIGICIGAISNISDLFLTLIPFFYGFSFLFIFCRKAFVIITFTYEGIENRYLNIKWEEINYVSVDYMKIFKYQMLNPPKLKFLYVSTNEQYCSFKKYKKHQNQCILMPLNKKNLNNLLKYSDGRSQAIIDFVALQERAKTDN